MSPAEARNSAVVAAAEGFATEGGATWRMRDLSRAIESVVGFQITTDEKLAALEAIVRKYQAMRRGA